MKIFALKTLKKGLIRGYKLFFLNFIVRIDNLHK